MALKNIFSKIFKNTKEIKYEFKKNMRMIIFL